MKTASTEREAIVAYLRGESAPRPTIWNYYDDQRGDYVHDLAAAIERGEHLKDQDHGRA